MDSLKVIGGGWCTKQPGKGKEKRAEGEKGRMTQSSKASKGFCFFSFFFFSFFLFFFLSVGKRMVGAMTMDCNDFAEWACCDVLLFVLLENLLRFCTL